MTREKLGKIMKESITGIGYAKVGVAIDRILAALAAEKVEPMANEGLVQELRKWWQNEPEHDDLDDGKGEYTWRYKFDEILSKYHPVPSLPVEPLAVLADRKGVTIGGMSAISPYGDWKIVLVKVCIDWPYNEKAIIGPTYEAAELSARAFLSSLKDKEGGV
jgi:hypothetical protein